MKDEKLLRQISLMLQQNKSNPAFSLVSDIKYLRELTPLSTEEMHRKSAELISRAQKEVLIQFYKCDDGCDGANMINSALRELKNKAQQNKSKIIVKIMTNSRGNISQLLYRKQGKNGFIDLVKELNGDYFQIDFFIHRTNLFDSLHSKFIVVDGENAILRGGDPVKDNNLVAYRFESALIGDASLAKLLKQEFITVWNKFSDHKLKISSAEIGELKKEEIPEKKFEKIPFLFISKKESRNPVEWYCGPYKIALITAIKKAEQVIKISTANLNDPDIITTLAAACNRGIEVKIVLSKYHNESGVKKWGGTNSDSMGLLVSKVQRNKLANLQIRWSRNKSGHLALDKDLMLHTKYVSIDDILVFNGSSPIDKQAMYHSNETDIIFESKLKTKEFNAKFFDPIFTQGINYFSNLYDDLKKNILKQTIIFKKSDNFYHHNLGVKLERILRDEDPNHSFYEKIQTMIMAIQLVISEALVSNLELANYLQPIRKIVDKYRMEKEMSLKSLVPIELTFVSTWKDKSRSSDLSAAGELSQSF